MFDTHGLFDSQDSNHQQHNQQQQDHHQSASYLPGSLAAKKAWYQIDQDAHSYANIQKAKALGHENATGMYHGRPLVPGAGYGQGDYQFLVDKLVYSKGFSPEVAHKIAGKIRWGQ